MTVPSTNISLNDIQTEWGGSAPISLSEYYRGAYVPTNYTNTGNVPTSGTISMSQLAGTYAESDGATCLSNFWANRAGYFRRALEGGSSVWPADTFDRNTNGGSVNRYLTSVATSASYANSALLGASNKYTIIHLALGSSASITSSTAGRSSGNDYDWAETSVRISRYSGVSRNLTASDLTYSRSGGNSGSWSKMIVLPGHWGVAAVVDNPTANSGSNYIRTLPAQRCALFVSGSGGSNGSDLVGYTGTNVIQGSEWWYNSSAMYFCVNPTYAAQTMSWETTVQVPTGYDNYGAPLGYYETTGGLFKYNRRLFELYLI